ncbi:odorant-binding protein-like [Hipposideros larvatus]
MDDKWIQQTPHSQADIYKDAPSESPTEKPSGQATRGTRTHMTMKTVLLILLLGLGCADLATVDVSKLSGPWKTLHTAASDTGKISETGPFRVFMRKVNFGENDSATFEFFVKINGECVFHNVTARNVKGNVYTADYAGLVVFHIAHASENSLVFHGINMDENGVATRLTKFIGRENDANKEDFAKFKNLTREKNIPDENIVNTISFDTCPTSS